MCNNIKISQIYYNILILQIFDVELDVKNEWKGVSKMWENAYMSIENPKAFRQNPGSAPVTNR